MNRVAAMPEVVADQDEALHVLAVALPQGLDQLGVLLRPLGVQPLLELVEHQQHLLAARGGRPRGPGAAAARRASRSARGCPAGRGSASAGP